VLFLNRNSPANICLGKYRPLLYEASYTYRMKVVLFCPKHVALIALWFSLSGSKCRVRVSTACLCRWE
jgi:hypothetical protein